MYYYQDGTASNDYNGNDLNGILIGPFEASGVNQYFCLSHSVDEQAQLGEVWEGGYLGEALCLYDIDVKTYNDWFSNIQSTSFDHSISPALDLAYSHKLKVLGIDVFPHILPCIWLWNIIIENIDEINNMIIKAGGNPILLDAQYWMLDGCYFPQGICHSGVDPEYIIKSVFDDARVRAICPILENMIIK